VPDAGRAVNAGGPVAPNSVKCDTVSGVRPRPGLAFRHRGGRFPVCAGRGRGRARPSRLPEGAPTATAPAPA